MVRIASTLRVPATAHAERSSQFYIFVPAVPDSVPKRLFFGETKETKGSDLKS